MARAARRHHARGQLVDLALDVIDRTMIATLNLQADEVAHRSSRLQHFGWVLQQLDMTAVAEPPAAILAVKRDAVIHVVEHGLHQRAGALDILLGGGQRLLAIPEFGDVAAGREQAAVGQRVEVELDGAAGRGAPLIAIAAGLAHQRGALAHGLLDVDTWAVIAARDAEAQQVVAGETGVNLGRPVVLQPHHRAIDELHAELRIEQRDALAHVVEDDPHHLRRVIDLARRGALAAAARRGGPLGPSGSRCGRTCHGYQPAIVAADCIVGVSRQGGFVSSVSPAVFLPQKSPPPPLARRSGPGPQGAGGFTRDTNDTKSICRDIAAIPVALMMVFIGNDAVSAFFSAKFELNRNYPCGHKPSSNHFRPSPGNLGSRSNTQETEMALKTGNSGNNVLVGSSVHDEIWGFQGDDLLKGGGGDDYLNGGTGIDTMYGGTGDDSYNVDNVNDQVVEYEDQGNDTISAQVTYSLNYALQVENLTLTGSADIDGYGNALDNVIKGNSGDNALWGLDGHDHLYGGAGDDYLNGGASYDVMYGGTGDDYYVVDNISDFVTEHAGEGIDTVASSTHFTMFGEIENLILTGSSNIFGHGNELDNQITGNSGGNHIDGGLGADLMKGGDGNDTYEVDNAGDVVMEFDDKGYDKVKVSFDYQLSANVERLSLLGSANLTGKGNDLANDLYGNSGHNTLYGRIPRMTPA